MFMQNVKIIKDVYAKCTDHKGCLLCKMYRLWRMFMLNVHIIKDVYAKCTDHKGCLCQMYRS